MPKWAALIGSIGLASALALLAVGLLLPTKPAAAQLNVHLKIDPVQSHVEAGETFSVTVRIERALDLGAFQFDLAFDPEILKFQGAQLGPFLGSTGRTVSAVPPLVAGDHVTYAAVSGTDQPGANGSGDLVYVTMLALSAGTSRLALLKMTVLDTQGEVTVPDNDDGFTVVREASTPTPTATATPVPTPTPMPTPIPPAIYLPVTFRKFP